MRPLKMHLVDSHCHLDFEQFDEDREAILSHCKQLGIRQIIVPGVTACSWSNLISICQTSDMLYPALGLHPLFMDKHQPEHIVQLKKLAKDHAVAIGEIGLDFYIKDHDKTAQIHLLCEQLHTAITIDLPVILHVRKAHDQVIDLLKQFPVKGGIVHAFSGSLQQAQYYIKAGFFLGVGGAITHIRASRLRQLFSELPLSSLVLETDAPDMPLAGMKAQRNTPENILAILTSLAEIRTESKQEIATATTNNCRRLFPALKLERSIEINHE